MSINSDAADVGAAGANRGSSTRKVVIFGLCAVSACLMYVIRTLPSIAIDGPNGMAQEYGWSNTDRGKVLSAFFYGYCALQWPGGFLASRWGGKGAMLIVVVGSAAIQSAIPFVPRDDAGSSSVLLVSVLRACTGLVQGPLYPTWAALVSEWLSPEEFAMASGTFSAGSCFGIVVAWLAGPAIMDDARFGWRWTFWGSALITIPWAVAWVLLATSRPPAASSRISSSRSPGDGVSSGSKTPLLQNSQDDFENTHQPMLLNGSAQPPNTPKPGTPLQVLSSPAFHGGWISSFAGGWALYMLLTFLPQYMGQRFNFQLAKAGWSSMLPYLMRGIVLLVAGYGADWLVERAKWRTVNVRLAMTVFPLLASAANIVHASNAEIAVIVLTVGVALTGTLGAGAGLVPLDLFPTKVGGLFGIFNMIINTPGFITPYVTGVMLDRHNCPSVHPSQHNCSNHSSSNSSCSNGTTPWRPMTHECMQGWEEAFLVAAGLLGVGAIVAVVTFKVDKRYSKLR